MHKFEHSKTGTVFPVLQKGMIITMADTFAIGETNSLLEQLGTGKLM